MLIVYENVWDDFSLDLFWLKQNEDVNGILKSHSDRQAGIIYVLAHGSQRFCSGCNYVEFLY